MNAGDTFIPQCKPYNHLYIVLSDPSQDEERVVLVNLTTWTVDEESHCIVQKGEHRFVKHKTAVRYNGAKLASVSELERLTNTGMLKSDRPLSPELLKRVRDGAALAADRIPEECRQVLDDQGLI